MSQPPKRNRGSMLVYALIPGGFLILVALLVFTGFFAQGVTETPGGTMQEPAPTQAPANAQPDATPPPAGN